MFDILPTRIDGLDAILAGGIRYPAEQAAFAFVTGGPGSGKTLLALELVTRAWLHAQDGSHCLYYSVEHDPRSLVQKLEFDFEFFGTDATIEVLPQEVPHKICVQATTARGQSRLVLTQANPAGLERPGSAGTVVNVDWILAEVGNYRHAGPISLVCVDNTGLLLTDLDYYGKRAALLATRRELMANRIHGIFVQEVTNPTDLRMPSPEEFSTDLLIELSFQDEFESFKARSIEITKARHQYYYRGKHHFSIAGRGMRRDVYLGARNERGPGLHIYPSVAAQLSIARDSQLGAAAPPRGSKVIDLGHPDLLAAFLEGTGPTAHSSSVLLAEPGTRYTYLALRFLAAGLAAGETCMMVSTKEDADALLRICQREPSLAACVEGDGFSRRLRVLYLHPEFISPGKFAWDLMRLVDRGADGDEPASRIAFDNIYRLADRFPLLRDQPFMIPALIDMLRYKSVTPLFVDLVPPGSASGRTSFDPARYMTTFDHVFHVYLDDDDSKHTPRAKILKSISNEFTRRAVAIDYDAV